MGFGPVDPGSTPGRTIVQKWTKFNHIFSPPLGLQKTSRVLYLWKKIVHGEFG